LTELPTVHSGARAEVPPIVLLVAHAPIERSTRVLEGPASPADDTGRRLCPACGCSLEWVERGTIGGISFDYFRWCLEGCGLYCFDRSRSKWVKLA